MLKVLANRIYRNLFLAQVIALVGNRNTAQKRRWHVADLLHGGAQTPRQSTGICGNRRKPHAMPTGAARPH